MEGSHFSLGRPLTRAEKRERVVQRRSARQKNKDKDTIVPVAVGATPGFVLKRNWIILPSDTIPAHIRSSLLTCGTSLTTAHESLDSIASLITAPPFRREANPQFTTMVFRCPLGKRAIFGLYTESYLKELLTYVRANARVRGSLRRFLRIWLRKRLVEAAGVDLVTLDPPTNPVTIYDWTNRRTYTFEARTLFIDIQRRLLQHDGLIPNSQRPRNPYTNMNLSIGQLWSITEQFRAKGLTHWALEALREAQYEFVTFKLMNERNLKLAALKSVFHEHASEDLRGTMLDFIEYQHENHGAHFSLNVYKWALMNEPDHKRIQEWKRFCYSYYRMCYVYAGCPQLHQMLRSIIDVKTAQICCEPVDLIVKRRLWLRRHAKD